MALVLPLLGCGHVRLVLTLHASNSSWLFIFRKIWASVQQEAVSMEYPRTSNLQIVRQVAIRFGKRDDELRRHVKCSG